MTAAPMPRPVAVLLLLGVAVAFAANHVAARVAFDNGVNVLTAVTVRSAGTALVLVALLRAAGIRWRLSASAWRMALGFGALITVQSLFLYSAVARIPVALALLTFGTFPIVLAAISWLTGGERPLPRVLAAMPVALFGLALALGVVGAGGLNLPAGNIATGVGFAFAAALVFGIALHLATTRLREIDGRLRSCIGMGVVAILGGVAGLASDGFAWPQAAPGWVGLALLTVLYGTAFTSTFILLPRLGAVNNAAILNFEPIAALFLAWLILGQAVGVMQLVGALVVIGAIVVVATVPRK
ncbi:MAG: EamA family transporter [Burkholderiales bacterium]